MMKVLFHCEECDGPVEMKRGPGRIHEFRPGIRLPIPDEIPTATCAGCGQVYLRGSDAEDLAKHEPIALARFCSDLIRQIRAVTNVTQRQLEIALAVTPTYLSHVVSGRKKPSLTLVRLMQAYAAHPEQVQRHLAGIEFTFALRPVSLDRTRYEPDTEATTQLSERERSGPINPQLEPPRVPHSLRCNWKQLDTGAEHGQSGLKAPEQEQAA